MAEMSAHTGDSAALRQVVDVNRPVRRITSSSPTSAVAKGEINPDGLRIASRAQRHMRKQMRHVLERVAWARGPMALVSIKMTAAA